MKKNTSIVFTGDIGFDKYMEGKWEDENLLSKPILNFFHSADHVCANVEGAVYAAPEDENRDEYFHAMNPKAVDVLNKMQADIWCIGNNHAMDAGAEGLNSTRKIAKENGCETFGAGMNRQEASKPVYLDEAGGIGLLSLTYVCASRFPKSPDEPNIFSWEDWDVIAQRIKEIKSKCRWCVIVCHGGEEFTPMPSTYTRDRYIKYLELGADIVVGHHPHVPENYELFDDGKMIFYSLGNFIFDTNYQRAHAYTDVGILLKLIFTEDKIDFEAVGIKINRKTERLDIADLPDIFANISAEEYELLSPLGAKAFVAEEIRRMIFLHPETYTDYSLDDWNGYFFSDRPVGYHQGKHMDFAIVVPHSYQAESEQWKQSKLENVKNYLISLL